MKFRKFLCMLLVVTTLIVAVPAFDVTAFAKTMPYRIDVDLTSQIVTIYDNQTNEIVRQFLCTSGAKDATPTGTFYMPPKEDEDERQEWYFFRGFGVYARYATRVYKGIMFHSLLYNKKSMSSLSKVAVKEYGRPASHGCLRVRWQDAEFIAKNCLVGTQVKIYKSGKVDEELRELLFQSSYTNENGMTYNQFWGIPDEPGVMGRSSEGKEVEGLQMRLRDLGIYTDEINGIYRGSTVTAVRDAQTMLGMEPTGIATLEFQQAISAPDAPSAMNVVLQEGMSGPAVRNFQDNLSALGIYGGNVDGVFDVDVVEAVKLFEAAYGYPTDGIASTEIQKAVYYEAGRVKAMFAMEGGYTFEKVDEEITMGRVNCKIGVRLREKASVKSDPVTLLRLDDVVVVRERGEEWSQVMKGRNSGFVKSMYIDFYPQTISSFRYTGNEGKSVYTIGYTSEDYFSGAARPADIFSDYLASGGSLTDYEGLSNFATVKTDSDDISLNLREAATSTSNILAVLPNGTNAKVLLRSNEWTLVEYNGLDGYVMNDYLEYWTGPEDALEPDTDEAEDDGGEDVFGDDQNLGSDKYAIEHAVADCETDSKAPVYDDGSANATVLGNLKNGIAVDVLQTRDGWCLISYQEHQGYMREDDLQFVVDGVTT